MTERKLYRSVHGKVIGGVAGGLAEFFGMDPTIMRLVFVLLFVFGGSGLLIYIILWIVIPEKPMLLNYSSGNQPPNPAQGFTPSGDDTGRGETYEGFYQGKQQSYAGEVRQETGGKKLSKMDGGLIGGLILILIGTLFLIERFIPRISFGDLWPILLIAIGLTLIFGNLPKGGKRNEESGSVNNNEENNTQTF